MFSNHLLGLSLPTWRRCVWIILAVLSSEVIQGVRSEFSYEAITAVLARINITYNDPITKIPTSVTAEIGRFADGAIGQAKGVLVAAKPTNTTQKLMYLQGCLPNWAAPPEGETWVALLFRGGCSDEEKVKIANAQNASAVLLFGSDQDTLQKETKFQGDAIVVYLMRRKGDQLSYLVKNNTRVYVSITRGQEVKFRITSINRTSVLFVSVSFIVLMIVSLAWLIFYYIQRFRYINAKDKLARHLCNAAKKALAKIPVKNLKNDDMEVGENDSCAVCIEPYLVADTLRTLPCKHQFHKGCVDPWLLEHRTCPMCKMDILKYYGYIQPVASERRTDSLEEASAIESGTYLGFHDPTLSRRRNDPQEILQVSVISQAEVLPRSNTLERTSSIPVHDASVGAAHNNNSNASVSTSATALIRSAVLSARSRIVPADSCAPTHSQPHRRKKSTQQISKVSTAVEESGITETHPTNERISIQSELNENCSDDESVASSSSHLPSFSSSSTESEVEKSTGNLPEGASNNEKASPNSQHLTRPFKDNEYLGYDIEYLVKEIIDLEQDENTDKSIKQFDSQTSLVTEELPSCITDSLLGHENHPKSECPSFPSRSDELTEVDCEQPQTHMPLNFDRKTSSERLLRSKTLSSIPSCSQKPLTDAESSSGKEDFTEDEESKRRSLPPSSEGDRRPSSHLVTISHS